MTEDEYNLQAPAVNPERPPVIVPGGLFQAMAEVRREEAPPPPEWPLFMGVFEFPWTRGVLSRWILLSAGCSAMFLLAGIVLMVARSMSGPFGAVMAFFALPQIWITLWTLSYASSCGLQILEDTAAGNNEVVEWPEPNWREWAWKLYYVLFLLSLGLSVGYGVACLLRLALPLGSVGVTIVTVLVAVLLFPVMLLSSSFENSIWMVGSPGVLRGLAKHAVWTATCYGLILAMWSVVAGLAVLGLMTIAALFVIGPAMATAIFVSARLLGRLAWKIQERPKRRKGAVKEPSAPAEG